MKKSIFIFFIGLSASIVTAQTKKARPVFVDKPELVETVPKSGLHAKESGLPLNLGVLSYKDSTLLAIEPSEVSNTFIGYNSKIYDYKYLKGHGFTFFFPKDKLTNDEVIKLVSTYGFHLTDGILKIVLSQQGIEWKQQKLPPYLHFSIEGINLD